MKAVHANQSCHGLCCVYLSGDQEEFQVNAERLICRCLSVDVKVMTPRTDSQEEALAAANNFLEEVQRRMTDGAGKDKDLLKGLINACNPDHDPSGTVDDKFQSLVLACAVEDQKKIRRRVNKWSNSIHGSK